MKRFKFSYDTRSYDIWFNKFNILFLIGDSGTGKTLFFNDLNAWRIANQKTNILTITYDTMYENLRLMREHIDDYDLIVIDRADLIIDNNIDFFICNHLNKNWIIIGRKIHGCVPSLTTLGRLVKEGNKITVKYGVI